MDPKRKTIRDLAVTLEDDGRIRVRSLSRRVIGRFDAEFLLVLSACKVPRARTDIVARHGAAGGRAFDQLEAAGLLAPPEEADDTPHFFHGFTNVNLQRAMLADRARLESYRAALQRLVRPGDVVIDAGTGSGILAVYAARAGARRVFAVDNSGSVEVAKRVAADNGLARTIEVVRGDFSRVILPEQADLIVTETFGVMFFTEGAGPELAACARNCLKPGGRIIPAEFSLHVAGLRRAGPELLAVFENRDDGVDLSCLHGEAMRRAVIDEVDPASIASTSALGRWPVTLDIRERPLRTTATLDGPCAAIAGWFDLHLAEGITLSTAPGAGATSWHQVVFPVALPAGRHEIEMTFSFNPEAGRYVQVEFGEPVGRTIGIG